MEENIKLIIEIDKEVYDNVIAHKLFLDALVHAAIENGIPVTDEPKSTKDNRNIEKLVMLGECKCNTCKHKGTWACNNCHCFDKYEGGAKMKGGERE